MALHLIIGAALVGSTDAASAAVAARTLAHSANWGYVTQLKSACMATQPSPRLSLQSCVSDAAFGLCTDRR